MADKKNDDFGEAWDRDPNRINTHLQVRNLSALFLLRIILDEWHSDQLVGNIFSIIVLSSPKNRKSTFYNLLLTVLIPF